MAITNDDLLVSIKVNTQNATKSLDDLNKKFESIVEIMGETEKKSKSTSEATSGLGGSIIVLNQALEIAKKAWDTLAEPVMEVTKAYFDQIDAETRLGNSMRLRGTYSDKAVESFIEFSKTMQRTRAVSDDLVLSMAAMSTAIGLNEKQTKKLILTASDLSSVTGQDLKASFDELLESYKGQARGLAVYDKRLKDLTEDQLKAGAAVDILGSNLDAYSEKNLKTFSGQSRLAHENLEDMKKTLGFVIASTLNMDQSTGKLAATLGDLNDYLDKNKDTLVAIGKTGLSMVIDGFGAFGRVAMDVIHSIMGGFNAILAGSSLVAQGFLKMVALGEEYGHFFGKADEKRVAAANALYEAQKKSTEAFASDSADAFKNIGQYGKSTYEELFEGNEKVTKAAEEYNKKQKDTAAGYLIIGEKGRAAIEDLVKKYDELAKSASESGLLEGELIKAKERTSERELDQLVKKLTTYKAMTPEVKKLVEQTRALAKEGADRDTAALRRKDLDDLLAKNEEIYQQTDLTGVRTLDLLKRKHDAEMDSFQLNKLSLIQQGLYTDQIKEAVDRQEQLLKLKATKENNDAPSKEYEDAAAAGRGIAKDINGALAGNIKGMAGAALGMTSGAGAIMEAVKGVLSFVQQIINFIPEVIDAISGIFNSLADFGKTLSKSFNGFLDAIVNFAGNFIPNLIDGVSSMLEKFVSTIADAIPKVVGDAITKIPDMLSKLLDRIPKLIGTLVKGLVSAIPLFMKGFAKGIPQLFAEFMKLIPAIAYEFWNGVWEGLKNVFKSFFGGGGMKIDAKIDTRSMSDAVSKVGKALTNAASQMFNVSDLTKAFSTSKTDPVKGVEQETKKAGNFLSELWKKFLAALKSLWTWIYDKVLKPILDGIREVWDYVYDKVLKPILDGIKNVWDKVIGLFQEAWDKALSAFKGIIDFFKESWDGLVNSFKDAFQFFSDVWKTIVDLFTGKIKLLDGIRLLWSKMWDYVIGVFNGIVAAFQRVFSYFGGVLGGIVDAFKSIWEGFGNLGGKIVEGFKNALSGVGNIFSGFGGNIWDGLKGALGGLGKFFTNIFDEINPTNLFSKIFKVDMGGKGTVEKTLGIDIPFMAFAQGGNVPGVANVAGDSPMNDKVLAMLSPGEVVIPRSIAQDPKMKKVLGQLMTGNVPHLFGGTLGGLIDKAGQAVSGVTDFAGGIFNGGGNILNDLIKYDPTGASQMASGIAKKTMEESQKFAKNPEEYAKQNLTLQRLWSVTAGRAMDMIMKMFESNKFATGGLVTGSGMSDSIPALLTPGEFVMKRSAVAQLGLGQMSQMNAGGLSQSGSMVNASNVSVTLNISTSQTIDEGFIKAKLMPTIKSEIKRASQDGHFVISSKGIRTS